jgi:MoxR-like ATPase
MPPASPPETDQILQNLGDIRAEIGRHILGQTKVVDLTLTALLARGHGLLVGVPGLAKTRLVETIATVLGLDTQRVQCTPDLMPGDVLGSEVLDQGADGKRNFRFIKGPVFTQLLMVDEINRAGPRTQSAFLQAMQERKITVGGTDYALPQPFQVLATQNPIEHDGTYPLPEAQLDRFLLQINIDFPDRTTERDILRATTTGTTSTPRSILNAEKLIYLQDTVDQLPIGDKVIDAILTLVRRARPGPDGLKDVAPYLDWAPGVRASQTLSLASRAYALLNGRTTPSVDDVIALAPAALQHRLRLNYRAAADGITADALVARLTNGL